MTSLTQPDEGSVSPGPAKAEVEGWISSMIEAENDLVRAARESVKDPARSCAPEVARCDEVQQRGISLMRRAPRVQVPEEVCRSIDQVLNLPDYACGPDSRRVAKWAKSLRDGCKIETALPSPRWRDFSGEVRAEDDAEQPCGSSALEDNWQHRSEGMRCRTCIFYVPKNVDPGVKVARPLGRCRRSAPTMKGFPVVFTDDWCGEHRLDENKA